MTQFNLKPETKAWIIWFTLLLALLMAVSCASKTKTKTQHSKEEKLKKEARISDSIARSKSIISTNSEKFSGDLKEMNRTDSEELTEVVEVEETIENTGQNDYVVTTPDGNIITIAPNGRISKTKKTTTSHKKTNEILEKNNEISQRSQEQINEVNSETQFKAAVNNSVQEIVTKDKTKDKFVKTTGLGFWFWFWIILLLVLALALYIYRKWLGIQFPFLKLFKFFR
jgi:Flp pilus assembly protein TadB